MAERFGWNKPPSLAGAQESTIPAAAEIKSPLDLGSSAIGQGRVLATPLQMASVAQTMANDGVRVPPTLLPGVRRRPRRVISRADRRHARGADGRAWSATAPAPRRRSPGVQVAGKTGTAELGDTRGPDAESRAPRTPTPGSPPTRRPSGRGWPWACCSCATAPAESTAAPAARIVLGRALGK